MENRIHILIAEPSIIIRSGMVGILNRMHNLNIDIAEIADVSTLSDNLNKYRPNILIIAPSYLGLFSINKIKNENKISNLKIILCLTL